MFNLRKLALIPALALAAACAEDAPKQDVDASLANDLSLAGQAQPAPVQQFVSPAELAEAPAPEPAVIEAPAPAPRATAARRTTTRRVASSATGTRRTTTRRPAPAPAPAPSTVDEGPSSGTVYESPAPAPAPEPRTVEVKHTKRDAIIGAAAGAVLGAATSRDKVKGAVIGAAAGGVLGAIIGSKVDVTRKPAPQF